MNFVGPAGVTWPRPWITGEAIEFMVRFFRDWVRPARGVWFSSILAAYVPGDLNANQFLLSNSGYVSENDLSFGILVGRFLYKKGVKIIDKLYWFAPYMWIDDEYALEVGKTNYFQMLSKSYQCGESCT